MPNLGTALKSEISRLAKREIRGEIASLKKQSALHRRHIAALKRQVADLERTAVMLTKKVSPTAAIERPDSGADGSSSARFQARGFRSLRKRLGLSAPKMAKLLGVSNLSVYNWELGKSTPRKRHLAAIVKLRSLGKREVQVRLDQ